ncbi:MAG: hypothetical protein EAZ55_02330 [Cytophagales bacterium]|nr:MAG: hypothetical protein EAZ55_02330 [Cytophagales bacterium]
MPIKKIVGLIYILFLPTWLHAQVENQVRSINDFYFYVNDQITAEKYLLLEAKFNAFQRKNIQEDLPQQYQLRIFFTKSDEEHYFLRAIKINEQYTNIHYNTEFVFNEATELILFTEEQNDTEKYPYRQLKVYFENQKPIYFDTKPTIETDLARKRVQEIMEMEEELKNYFLVLLEMFKKVATHK